MNELLKIWVSLSFSGTLLILLFFLCKPLWRERTSKRWQYYIWLIVILRLLLPFTPETSPVGSMFASLGQTMAAQTHRTPAAVPHDRAMPPDNSAKPAHPPAAASREPDSMFASLLGPTVPAAIGHSLWLVWLLVAAGLLIRKITIYQAFVKYMRAGRTEVSDTAWLDRLAEIGAQIGVKRPVELYTNRLISSPLLLGFFRPCIVLPTADLCASDFYYTVLHELVHERRRDMLYKWLVQLTLCLHWFNPAVYRMGQEISRACELACDEAVIRGLPPSGRRDYGDTLLRAVGAGGGYRDSIASVTLHESKKCLKERLEAMLHLEKVKRIKPVFAALLALCLLGGGFAMGAYSARPAWDRTTPGQLTDEGLPVMSAKNRACYDAYVAPVMVTGLLTHNFSPEDVSGLLGDGGHLLMGVLDALEQEQVIACHGKIPVEFAEEVLLSKLPLQDWNIREACASIYTEVSDTYAYSSGLGGGPAVAIVTDSLQSGNKITLRYTWYLGDPSAEQFRYTPGDRGELILELKGNDFRYISNQVIE